MKLVSGEVHLTFDAPLPPDIAPGEVFPVKAVGHLVGLGEIVSSRVENDGRTVVFGIAFVHVEDLELHP